MIRVFFICPFRATSLATYHPSIGGPIKKSDYKIRHVYLNGMPRKRDPYEQVLFSRIPSHQNKLNTY